MSAWYFVVPVPDPSNSGASLTFLSERRFPAEKAPHAPHDLQEITPESSVKVFKEEKQVLGVAGPKSSCSLLCPGNLPPADQRQDCKARGRIASVVSEPDSQLVPPLILSVQTLMSGVLWALGITGSF